ncbi:MAG: hypothetical protein JWO91_2433 [Acidobacteriaceae bacterium]|nr:hypothetical protein [Acidobacteriaceae bacterium]
MEELRASAMPKSYCWWLEESRLTPLRACEEVDISLESRVALGALFQIALFVGNSGEGITNSVSGSRH